MDSEVAPHQREFDNHSLIRQRCKICWKKYLYTIDPRLLPCQHFFCLPCLEKVQKDKGTLQCVVCCKDYNQTELHQLPAAEQESLRSKNFDSNLKCDCCPDKLPALVYCEDCDLRLCELNTKAHSAANNSQFSGHLLRNLKSLTSQPVMPFSEICQEKQHPASMVCRRCRLQFCTECHFTNICDQVLGWEHVLVDIAECNRKGRERMRDQINQLRKKAEGLKKLEGECLNDKVNAEMEVDRMTETVAKIATDNKWPLPKKKQVLKDMSKYLAARTANAEHYLMQVKQTMEDVKGQTNCVEHLLALPWNAKYNLIKLEQNIVSMFKEMTKVSGVQSKFYTPQVYALFDSKQQSARPFIWSTAPSHLIYQSYTPRVITSVCWTNDGNLMGITETDVTVFEGESLKRLKSTPTERDATVCIHLVKKSDGFILMVYNFEANKFKLYKCDEDLAISKTRNRTINSLVNFHGDVRNVRVTYIVEASQLVWVDTSTKCLLVFTKGNPAEKRYSIPGSYRVADIHATPDGTLLVADHNLSVSVRKFVLEEEELSATWRHRGLADPQAICADGVGFVYVAHGYHREMSILSPTGVLMRTLKMPILKRNAILDMAVWRDQMAVACDGDGLYVLHICRDEMFTEVNDDDLK